MGGGLASAPTPLYHRGGGPQTMKSKSVLAVVLFAGGAVFAQNQNKDKDKASKPFTPTAAATPAKPPSGIQLIAPPASFTLTELQTTRLQRDKERAERWQDKVNEALQQFSADCALAEKENSWPAIQCNYQDLTALPAPAPTAQQNAAAA